MKNQLNSCLGIATLLACAFTSSGQEFNKGKLLYENAFSSQQDVSEWVMEGPGKLEFKNSWMHMYSIDEAGHHVFWCPEDFPANFVAEWELQNQETDAGLCIVFFAAKGLDNEDIFDPSLPARDGSFKGYIKGAINNYHISYYANGKDKPGREIANLRKNKGFKKVQSEYPGIPVKSTAVHKVRLVKHEGRIIMYIDDRVIIDWTDDEKHGAILADGKIGLRQMKWTHFTYRNFKVWESVVGRRMI